MTDFTEVFRFTFSFQYVKFQKFYFLLQNKLFGGLSDHFKGKIELAGKINYTGCNPLMCTMC